MRVNGFRAVAALASVVLVAGCGTTVAGSSSGAANPPVLRIGASGGVALDAAKISSASGLGGFRVDGVLPTGPAHASTYRVAAAGAAGVRRVAAALGLSTAPRRHAHGWVVTGGGLELRMRDTGEWSLQRVGDECPPYQTDVDSADGSAGVACAVASDVGVVPPMAGSGPSAPVAAPVLSAEQLRKVADPLLTALGLDPKAAAVSVAAASVSVDPVVAGLPTVGYGTDLAIDARGLRGGTGWAYPAKPSVGDRYPLITARAALKLLATGPQPMMGAPEMACPVSTPAPADLPPACGGTTVVTGGRLGLELRWDGGYGSHPVLVPAWFLDVRGSDVPLVLVGLSPKYLADPVVPTAVSGTTPPNPVTSAVPPPASSGGGSAGSTGSSGAPVG